jgi:hypothetical protein
VAVTAKRSAKKATAKKKPKAAARTPEEAEAKLTSFIDKFEPKDRTLIRTMRRALRKRMPTANELVYDNYNFFVIGYGPNERPSDCIVSIAAGSSGVGLCFIRGASLRDPEKILLGSGNQTRFIRLESADVLARPEVEALLASAVAQSKTPLPEVGRGTLIIRSVSAKQRPRRKAAPTMGYLKSERFRRMAMRRGMAPTTAGASTVLVWLAANRHTPAGILSSPLMRTLTPTQRTKNIKPRMPAQ